jgi:hypothetical protein
MQYYSSNNLLPKGLIAGGSVLLAMWLLIDLQGFPSLSNTVSRSDTCQQTVNPQTKLSREQLARLLTVPEGDKRQKVQEILKEPQCRLASLQLRAGATAQRDAYPLDFDSQARLIVLYEGDQYAGFRFDLH